MIRPESGNNNPLVYNINLKNIELINQDEYFTVVIFYDGRIIPWYYVSNYGRIYSTKSEKILTPWMDSSGYYRISLTISESGKEVFTGVHKIELMSFYPITDPYRFIPNHKDGNKSNNYLPNLEWVTVSYNTRHALDNGLCNYIGTDSPRSYLTDEQVEFICECIKNGYDAPYIADQLGYTSENKGQNARNKMCAIIRNIRYGSAYMSISCKYDIPGMQGDYRFPEELAYEVCKVMSDPKNHNFDYDDLAEYLNIPCERRRYFKSFVIDIFKKAGYSDARNTYPNANRPLPIKESHKNYHLYF